MLQIIADANLLAALVATLLMILAPVWQMPYRRNNVLCAGLVSGHFLSFVICSPLSDVSFSAGIARALGLVPVATVALQIDRFLVLFGACLRCSRPLEETGFKDAMSRLMRATHGMNLRTRLPIVFGEMRRYLPISVVLQRLSELLTGDGHRLFLALAFHRSIWSRLGLTGASVFLPTMELFLRILFRSRRGRHYGRTFRIPLAGKVSPSRLPVRMSRASTASINFWKSSLFHMALISHGSRKPNLEEACSQVRLSIDSLQSMIVTGVLRSGSGAP